MERVAGHFFTFSVFHQKNVNGSSAQWVCELNYRQPSRKCIRSHVQAKICKVIIDIIIDPFCLISVNCWWCSYKSQGAPLVIYFYFFRLSKHVLFGYYSGRETPSLKMGSVVFLYYFWGSRLPVLCWLVGAPSICHQRHLAKNGDEDRRL